MPDSPVLSYLHYILGDLHPISELECVSRDPDTLDYLSSLGLRDYARFDEPVEKPVSLCVGQTLAASGLAPTEIEAIVYASCTLDPYRDVNLLGRVAVECGLRNAVPFGVNLGHCANFTHMLQVGVGLLVSRGLRHVLLISADKLDESQWPRLLDFRTSIFSDGVVCGLLSAESWDGYRLLPIVNCFRPELTRMDRTENLPGYIDALAEGFRAVCETYYEQTGMTPADFHWLLTGNYNVSVLKHFASLARFSRKALYSNNLARFAHSFAADQGIALADLAPLLTDGQKVMAVGSGGCIWGACGFIREKR